jgi:hypothetical protein
MNSLPLEDPSRRIGAPRNWDHSRDGLCHTLEIWDRDGYMISAWLPTATELDLLNKGHPILLSISGTVHPVVSLAVSMEPPKQIEL